MRKSCKSSQELKPRNTEKQHSILTKIKFRYFSAFSFSTNILRFRQKAAKFRRNIFPVQMLNEEQLRCIDPWVIKHSAALHFATSTSTTHQTDDWTPEEFLNVIKSEMAQWKDASVRKWKESKFESVFRSLLITSQKVHVPEIESKTDGTKLPFVLLRRLQT